MILNCNTGEDSLRVSWTARRSNQSILEYEVKWALGSIIANKVEVMEIQVSYFKS